MMNDSSTFDRLVKELNVEQRKELLRDIENSISVSDEPLFTNAEETPALDMELEYSQLSFLDRLFLMLKSLFTGKKRKSILQDHHLKQLKKKISRKFHRLIDFKHLLLLEDFKTEIEKLYKSAQFFREPIANIMGKKKAEFFAFLGSFDMPSTHQQLLFDIDPYKLMQQEQFEDISKLKENIEIIFKQIISEIPKAERTAMYTDCQALFYLHRFCIFNFEDFQSLFRKRKNQNKLCANFIDIEERMVSLFEILQSVKFPPSIRAFKAVFLFLYQEQMNEKNFDMETMMRDNIYNSQTALNNIRNFNKQIPLLDIIRCIKDKYKYNVKRIRGGEDWLVLYIDYWKKNIYKKYQHFYSHTKKKNCIQNIKDYLETKELYEIKYYNPHYWGGEYELGHWLGISFIAGFYEQIFNVKMNRALKILLIDGEFYKKENRAVFTDAYNYINKINEKINAIDNKLSPTGEYGKQIDKINSEKISPQIKKKNIQNLLKNVDREFANLLADTRQNLTLIINILNGVLYGEAGGKYDSISNIGFIGGRENDQILKAWDMIMKLADKALQILDELKTLETG